MNQNVLVTGGAGYIGSHACHVLAQAGYCPVTVDNLCLGHPRFVRWGPLIVADIRNTFDIVEIIRTHRISAVMHFAAFANVGESVANPLKYYDNNVGGTVSVLEAMRHTGVRKLVFSSTCAVYGNTARLPIDEHTPTVPTSPYGQAKLTCEAIMADLVAAGILDCITLRYFNASGASPKLGLGEMRADTRLIPRAIKALLGELPDFAINGTDFPTSDGTAVRDFIHVRDLADAHLLALNHLMNGGRGGHYNLGTGKGYSVKDIVDTIAAVAGRAVPAQIGPRRPGDPAEVIADNRLAARVLGFKPGCSDLATIIRTAWEWHLAESEHTLPSVVPVIDALQNLPSGAPAVRSIPRYHRPVEVHP